MAHKGTKRWGKGYCRQLCVLRIKELPSDSTLLGEDTAPPVLEARLSLLRVQLSPAAPAAHWSQHPVLTAALEFSPCTHGQGCVPSVGTEGLALQPVGVAQEMVGLPSRLN